METDKFQEFVLDALEHLKQENTEIRQTTNELCQRIDNIESVILRIESNLDQKFQALLEAEQVQIELNQKICDALNQNGGVEEAPPKGLFS